MAPQPPQRSGPAGFAGVALCRGPLSRGRGSRGAPYLGCGL